MRINCNSKYERWYYNIIEKCISENRDTNIKNIYYESHHIVPSSLGGSNDPDNKVLLTYREHVLCHWLLYKFTEGSDKYKMAYAFSSMINLKNSDNKRKNKITPLRILEAARLAHIDACRQQWRTNNPMHNPKIRQKVTETQTGQKRPKVTGKNNGMFGKTHTKESRDKIAEMRRNRKGETKSDKMKSKLSETATGRKRMYKEDGSWTWFYPN